MLDNINLDQIFFAQNSVNINNIHKIVNSTLNNSSCGELFLEFCQSESMVFDDNVLKYIDLNTRRGFGLRVFCESSTSFVCSSEISEKEISNAASIVRSSVSSNKTSSIRLKEEIKSLYPRINPINEIDLISKIKLLNEVNEYIRSKNTYVKQVKITLSGEWQVIQIIKDDYKLSDIRPLVCFNVLVIIEKNGRTEMGFAGHGGRGPYSKFTSEKKWKEIANQALEQALVNLEAIPTIAGEMVVVLGPGWPGILLHEAVGHGLEGDFNRKGVSTFSNSIGKQVAANGITVVDDGTLPNLRGSISIDDEGTTPSCNVLIENGILKGYMQDHMNAKLMGMNSTGNGRRESYKKITMPRMTNTYMLPGKHTPEEIISSVKKGLYAVNFNGGQVDITSGKFVFSSSEAYLIENGKITQPIKGATLIGDGPAVLKKISMVGSDLKLDHGVGTCLKDGQSIPVGVGQPTLKIDSIIVGGTEL
ncbi:metalloprotease TldD [Wolbachia endosymbiont of Dirofilaria (Dirofilaria) immitis]|uniref:metalloprotease TldD n=1 Tax=Wolbachia endosymbiont of Dirofilaria (Dirofilaria) immitis TaxID=1812115 RepID=UPI0015887A24|nr:metalloprotease TldD [Wolbachia endosymbiont of Dirofilaria (Dirofilaria) immitis]QKX02248.1 metalloprotease TldD [Wolbachia endosymbiont of Dirofilaria (Dirofilaria) immitis]